MLIHLKSNPRASCVRSQGAGFTVLGYLIRYLAAFLLVFGGTLVTGCGSTVTPTLSAIVKVSATPPPQPSATATAKPSRTPTTTPTRQPTIKPSATPTQPPPTPEPVYYVVADGDYVETIAIKFGITVDELVSANHITADTVLSVGEKLLIPTQPQPTVTPKQTQPENSPTATPEQVQPENSPSATPELVPTTIIHIVQKGETIDTIAAQYGVTVDEIAVANGINTESILSIGQELAIPTFAVATKVATIPAVTTTITNEPTQTSEPDTPVPAKVTYVVAKGDYLELIADHFGITAQELAEANGITIETVLSIGQELVIPNLVATPAPSPTPTMTPTLTPTAIVRVLPTARPTTTDTVFFPYQQPLLLAPVNNTVFEGPDASILLNWISVGILTDGEWYQVRIWKSATQESPIFYYTKTTSWRPPVGFYSSENTPYSIRWQVVVVDSVMADSTFKLKSSVSPIYSFYWR
jgi:LysM repeat protein